MRTSSKIVELVLGDLVPFVGNGITVFISPQLELNDAYQQCFVEFGNINVLFRVRLVIFQSVDRIDVYHR